MGSDMKGTGLYLVKKRGGDGIISSFVATRTNLLPSHNLSHEDGGMESTGSEPLSLSTLIHQTCSIQRKGKESPLDTRENTLVKIWETVEG